ncbi:MAG: amino acid permease, partial [Candidatus Bathyarchaeia archaeon]
AGALFTGIYGAVFIESITGASFVGLDLIIAVLAAIVMLLVAYRGISAGARTMITILVVQILLVFVIALWALAAASPNYAAPFDPSFTSWAEGGSPGNWAALAAAGFTFFFAFYGFDGTVVFAGEAKNPYRSCALGAILCILIVGGLYVFWAWSLMLPFTSDPTTFQSIAAAIITAGDVSPIAAQAGVALFGSANAGIALLSFALLLSSLGSGTAAALTISRILHAMGKDEVMPKTFGKLHPKYASPYIGALVVGIVTMLFPIGAFALGIPMINAFVFTATWCAWGVLIMYFFVNVDNIIISGRKLTAKNVAVILLGIIGAILMAYIWVSSGSAGIPGIAEPAATAGGPWWNSMMTPGFIWMIVGVIYLLYLRAAKPEALKRGITAV